MTYTEPDTKDLPRLAAEVIGWRWNAEWDGPSSSADHPFDEYRHYWEPHICANAAQYLINDAFARGFDLRLAEILCEPHHGKEYYKVFLTAEPETKTRAYLKAHYEWKKP